MFLTCCLLLSSLRSRRVGRTSQREQRDGWTLEPVDFIRHQAAGRRRGERYGRRVRDLHEIEKTTGQISQRPLPPAPGTSELSWVSQSSSSSPCSPLSATPKFHFCHCGKAYTLKSMRDRHVKMQHLNLRPFTCPVCSKSFKMKHHLTKHVKTHGGLRPYECTLCGKKIVWRDSFLKHQARCQGTTPMTRSGCQNDDADAPGQVKVEQDDYSLQDEEIHS